jgi:hypothetical protein
VVEHDGLKTPDGNTALFRMTDDQAILLEAKESIGRGECRHEP